MPSDSPDFGYLEKTVELMRKIEREQQENIEKAAGLMADAIEQDRLINVYGGGGHTTLVMGEMFFRAGGFANINPIMETGLSVFNHALKYLELERCVNYGRSIMKYFRLQADDVLIIFHNIGINPATIDAAMEAKEQGVKLIAVSSSCWQTEMPADHFIRHPNGKNLFDLADVCIDDYNEVGDCAGHGSRVRHAHRPQFEHHRLLHRPPAGDRNRPPVCRPRHRAAHLAKRQRAGRRRSQRPLRREVPTPRKDAVTR